MSRCAKTPPAPALTPTQLAERMRAAATSTGYYDAARARSLFHNAEASACDVEDALADPHSTLPVELLLDRLGEAVRWANEAVVHVTKAHAIMSDNAKRSISGRMKRR